MALSEINAIQTIDHALQGLDEASRARVLRWAWNKYVNGSSPEAEAPAVRPKPSKRKNRSKGSQRPIKRTRLTIVKSLNLRPKGKKSFSDFVTEKKPADNQQRCTAAVYYLKNFVGQTTVTQSDVYTCFKEVSWRIPANLDNTLRLVAHRKGWLDTADTADIKLTARGENLIEHDLPPKPSNKT